MGKFLWVRYGGRPHTCCEQHRAGFGAVTVPKWDKEKADRLYYQVDVYALVSARIEAALRALAPGELPRLCVVWIGPDCEAEERETCDPLLALLSITFPEVEFVEADSEPLCKRLTEVSNLLSWGYTPLFDGNGKRAGKIQSLRQWQFVSGGQARSKVAVAIDDEEEFALFHAYVAYRAGWRSHPVSSYRLLKELYDDLGSEETFAVQIEDACLLFRDYGSGELTVRQRDFDFSKLQEGKYRLFVTRGFGPEDKKYVEVRRTEGKNWSELTKPVAGVHRLQKELLPTPSDQGGWLLRLTGETWIYRTLTLLLKLEGYAKTQTRKTAKGEVADGHGAPGLILAAAERLLQRTREVQRRVPSVANAVYGAVLAGEAFELLDHRAPTTALEALALRHECETMAEGMFLGVEEDIEIAERLKDLKEEVERISCEVDEERRFAFELSARAQIVGRLVQVFRSQAQFEEEHRALAEARDLHRQVRYEAMAGPACLYWVPNGIERYVHYLLGSFTRFLFFIVAWVIGLWVLFYCTNSSIGAGEGLRLAFLSFLSMEPPDGVEGFIGVGPWWALAWRWGVVSLSIMTGIFHLGVFLAHVYAFVSRR